jgi:hypothetical protein
MMWLFDKENFEASGSFKYETTCIFRKIYNSLQYILCH